MTSPAPFANWQRPDARLSKERSRMDITLGQLALHLDGILVGGGADGFSLLHGKISQAAQNLCQRTFLAKVVNAPGLQVFDIVNTAYLLQGICFYFFNFFEHFGAYYKIPLPFMKGRGTKSSRLFGAEEF
jgi:hypothetical protein